MKFKTILGLALSGLLALGCGYAKAPDPVVKEYTVSIKYAENPLYQDFKLFVGSTLFKPLSRISPAIFTAEELRETCPSGVCAFTITAFNIREFKNVIAAGGTVEPAHVFKITYNNTDLRFSTVSQYNNHTNRVGVYQYR